MAEAMTGKRAGSMLIPSVRYSDAPAGMAWLERVLGFERQAVYDGPDGTVAHAQLVFGGTGMLMLGSAGNPNPNPEFHATPGEIGATNAAIAWAHARQGNYMQTPILVGNRVYGCVDNGVLTCFDARTGSISYSERIGSGSEGFTASPVSDGRNLFFASEVGNVYVVPADGKFSVSATNRLNETCMASPAIVGGTLLFRSREQLIAIGK